MWFVVNSCVILVNSCEFLWILVHIKITRIHKNHKYSQYLKWVKKITSILSWSNCFFNNHKICLRCPLLWLSCYYFCNFHKISQYFLYYCEFLWKLGDSCDFLYGRFIHSATKTSELNSRPCPLHWSGLKDEQSTTQTTGHQI